jgi:hypothetical protein
LPEQIFFLMVVATEHKRATNMPIARQRAARFSFHEIEEISSERHFATPPLSHRYACLLSPPPIPLIRPPAATRDAPPPPPASLPISRTRRYLPPTLFFHERCFTLAADDILHADAMPVACRRAMIIIEVCDIYIDTSPILTAFATCPLFTGDDVVDCLPQIRLPPPAARASSYYDIAYAIMPPRRQCQICLLSPFRVTSHYYRLRHRHRPRAYVVIERLPFVFIFFATFDSRAISFSPVVGVLLRDTTYIILLKTLTL